MRKADPTIDSAEPHMSRSQVIFAAMYAVSLQWWKAVHTLDGEAAMLVFIAYWAAATAYALAINVTWRGLLAFFVMVFIADLTASVATYVADAGAHSRDVPLAARPILSLIFAAIASSGLLLAFAARSLRRV